MHNGFDGGPFGVNLGPRNSFIVADSSPRTLFNDKPTTVRVMSQSVHICVSSASTDTTSYSEDIPYGRYRGFLYHHRKGLADTCLLPDDASISNPSQFYLLYGTRILYRPPP